MDKQQRDHNDDEDDDVGDDIEIQCKQSVDEDIRSMLSVTPVNVPPAPSGSQDGTGIDTEPGSNEDAFSSSSASTCSDDESSGESEETEDSGIEVEEDDDANDIDGEEEDEQQEEDDAIPLLESECTPLPPVAPVPTPQQSEWDRALMTGKPSKGRASDFFVPSQPILSTDSSEFYSTLQAARATAPGFPTPTHTGSSTSANQPHPPLQPPRPNSRNQTLQPVSKIQSTQGETNAGAQKRAESTPSVPTSATTVSSNTGSDSRPQDYYPTTNPTTEENLSAGVLPDVLMTMRQRIESINMFDSDLLRLTNDYVVNDDNDPMFQESRESLKRSSQQSISAAVLVSLAHKRYERRRLAAMEIEKVVRSLVVLQHQSKPAMKNELDRVRAILLLLSDDYVRSTNEDARKGGVVALAACAIGLKKANDQNPIVQECRDLILASVVHACQDHSQRVRYYATESLFNVVKVIPSLVVQHFFILFEVLRSLFADVDPDVRSGAELLDKKLKEVIVGAMNAGIFTAEQCVPVFARFVYMRNKATKRLTLTWLQELNEKLIGAPILEFLHLFLGGVIEMVADQSVAIRQSALAFLQSMLPKLLVNNADVKGSVDEDGMVADFDKILQSLVSTMEHPNPFVRKVAMYWMSRIIKAHMTVEADISSPKITTPGRTKTGNPERSAATSVRNAVSHVLPGILLSVGDNFVSTSTTKDAFLPDQTTKSLAEQTNSCLQDAVRRDGEAYVEHLDSFIAALCDEMAYPGGSSSKNAPAVERTPYRMDVLQDGTGIETAGWFRTSGGPNERSNENMVMSRLCALHWVIVLYDSVVPDALKADYAREFIHALIQQLVDHPPETIVLKTLEVLAKITVPVDGEEYDRLKATSTNDDVTNIPIEFPMDDESVDVATRDLACKSRDREVFATLIQLHADNEWLLADLSSVMTYMCKLQPPEFVMVSFAVELHGFIQRKDKSTGIPRPSDLKFVSACIQNMNHVIFNTEEARPLRDALKDCIAIQADTDVYLQRSRLFQILHHSFSHNIAATVTLCLWVGAYLTAHVVVNTIDPLDINLPFLLEIDRLIEMLERPLFRHLHVRMLELDRKQSDEGSGTMLFQLLKSILMILPQSTCYRVLRDRLVSASNFRQSTMIRTASSKGKGVVDSKKPPSGTDQFVGRTRYIRNIHCRATWQAIRQDSLEVKTLTLENADDDGADRRSWLGYSSKEEQLAAELAFRNGKRNTIRIEDISPGYHDMSLSGNHKNVNNFMVPIEHGHHRGGGVEEVHTADDDENLWKSFWATADR